MVSVENLIIQERRKKIILSNIFLGAWVAMYLLMLCCCIALVDDVFEKFISTIGVFFIPLIASLGSLFFVLGAFKFRFVTLDTAKKTVMDVQNCNEVSVEGMNKILSVIDKEKDTEHNRKEKIFKEATNQELVKEKSKIELIKELKA